MSRARPSDDPVEYLKFTRRIVRAAAAHAGMADPEQLAELVAIAREIDASISAAVHALRESGATWADIGAATGTSRQAAWEKWRDA